MRAEISGTQIAQLAGMNTQELQKDIQKGFDTMRGLRDEVKLKVHLAEMDVKDEWAKLEPASCRSRKDGPRLH